MKKHLLRFSACLFTALALAATVNATSPVLNQTGIVEAAETISLTSDSKGIIMTYGSSSEKASSGFFYIPKVESNGITLNKGIYYFVGGYLDEKSSLSKAAIETVHDLNVSATSTKKLALDKGGVTKDGSVLTSGYKLYTGKIDKKIYLNGEVMKSGYALSGGKMYKVSSGTFSSKTAFTGIMTKSYVDVAKSTYAKANGYYYKNGSPATAVVKLRYYKAGKPSTATGWVKTNSKGMYNGAQVYYLKKGKAVTGWKLLKSYSGESAKYKYNFDKNGVLRTNLFAWKRSYYIKQPLYIKVNLTTHNTTILAYDSATKKYDIPCITAICSTSRTKNGTKPIKKTFLEKTSYTPWFIFTESKPWHYYQYGVHIKKSASWFHSCMYRTKKPNTLIKPTTFHGYNNLGTKQTTACIRQQAGMAKLIYDIAYYNVQPRVSLKKQKQRIWVDIYRSGNKGPFGKITLADSTGKLSGSVKKDPTDPKYGNFLFK